VSIRGDLASLLSAQIAPGDIDNGGPEQRVAILQKIGRMLVSQPDTWLYAGDTLDLPEYISRPARMQWSMSMAANFATCIVMSELDHTRFQLGGESSATKSLALIPVSFLHFNVACLKRNGD
jgi:hypothetical protein